MVKRILIGALVAIGITIIGLIIFSILLTYTSIGENTILPVCIITSAISILIGSTLSTSSLKKNGIINGALIGIIYIFAIYLLSSIIEGDFSLSIKSIIMIIACIIAGAIGGVIGVNKG